MDCERGQQTLPDGLTDRGASSRNSNQVSGHAPRIRQDPCTGQHNQDGTVADVTTPPATVQDTTPAGAGDVAWWETELAANHTTVPEPLALTGTQLLNNTPIVGMLSETSSAWRHTRLPNDFTTTVASLASDARWINAIAAASHIIETHLIPTIIGRCNERDAARIIPAIWTNSNALSPLRVIDSRLDGHHRHLIAATEITIPAAAICAAIDSLYLTRPWTPTHLAAAAALTCYLTRDQPHEQQWNATTTQLARRQRVHDTLAALNATDPAMITSGFVTVYLASRTAPTHPNDPTTRAQDLTTELTDIWND